jgi:hypothetical protein
MNSYLSDSTGNFAQAEASYRQSRIRDDFRRAGGHRHTWSTDLVRRLTHAERRGAPALTLRPAPHN